MAKDEQPSLEEFGTNADLQKKINNRLERFEINLGSNKQIMDVCATSASFNKPNCDGLL